MSLLILSLCAGCTATPIVCDSEVVTVAVDRYVPIPEELTNPIPQIEERTQANTYEIGGDLAACTVRIDQCNDQLREIATLGLEP